MRAARATPGRVGVVLVEPMTVARVGLGTLLSSEADTTVLAEAADAGEGLAAIGAIERDHTRVVAMIGLELQGDRDAFWLIRAVREEYPQVIVLATGTDLDKVAISRALFVGADGFVNKNSHPERLVEAIRRAAQGETVLEGLPRGALGGIVEGLDAHRPPAAPVLTDRECEVLAAAAEGLTAREIGRRLGVAERTVTTHLNHIYRKLGASGRIAAISVAARAGFNPAPALVELPQPSFDEVVNFT